ncbi:MAG TPA: tetratricopeptide repeat protein [Polyangiaceae bacterium]|nr:tetratricopeptide repeat protein [Polyangiaceae bacterium]
MRSAATDEVAERFFDSTPHGYTPEPLPAAEASDGARATERRSLIHSPEARERRRYLTRYVAGAVGLAGLIGAVALVRLGVTHVASAATNDPSEEVARATAAELTPQTAAPEPIAAPTPAETAPAATADNGANANTAIANAGVTGAETPAPSAKADPSPGDAPAPAGESDAPQAPDPAAAALAKKEAQVALERGRLKTSVEAGERSVELDPSDAEAWLILGAAYQGRGRYNDARHCFSTCAKVATRGDRGECRALLR